jgi:hypothetical protein
VGDERLPRKLKSRFTLDGANVADPVPPANLPPGADDWRLSSRFNAPA